MNINKIVAVYCVALVLAAAFFAPKAYAGVNDKPRTTCEQDMAFVIAFADPSVSPQEFNSFVLSVQPGEKDLAVWQRIERAIDDIRQGLGRDLNTEEILAFAQMVQHQCYQVKGV